VANGNGNGVKDAIAGIFTSKLVGILFAIAFGSWSWTLNSLKNDVLTSVSETNRVAMENQRKIIEHEIFSARATAEFKAAITENTRRLETLEHLHGNGAKHNGDR